MKFKLRYDEINIEDDKGRERARKAGWVKFVWVMRRGERINNIVLRLNMYVCIFYLHLHFTFSL